MDTKNKQLVIGAVTGIVMVILIIALYLSGGYKNDYLQYGVYFVYFCGILFNAVSFSKANDGYVTFANIFASCFKTVLVVTLVVVLYTIVSFFVFPEIKETMINGMKNPANANPAMTKEQVAKSIEAAGKNYSTIMLSITIFSNLFAGAVFSAIGGIVAKKRGESPFVKL